MLSTNDTWIVIPLHSLLSWQLAEIVSSLLSAGELPLSDELSVVRHLAASSSSKANPSALDPCADGSPSLPPMALLECRISDVAVLLLASMPPLSSRDARSRLGLLSLAVIAQECLRGCHAEDAAVACDSNTSMVGDGGDDDEGKDDEETAARVVALFRNDFTAFNFSTDPARMWD